MNFTIKISVTEIKTGDVKLDRTFTGNTLMNIANYLLTVAADLKQQHKKGGGK